MKLAPASLRGRLLLVAAILIVVALAGAGGLTGFFLYRFMLFQVDQRLDTEIAAVASALVVGGDGHLSLSRPIETQPFDRPGGGWYWEVFDGDTRIRSASLIAADLHPPPPPPFWAPHWWGAPPSGEGPGPDRRPLHFRVTNVVVGDRTVMIAATAPRMAIWRPLVDALSPVLVALAIAAAALILAMLLQVRLGLRPLESLRLAIADVRAGRREHVPADQPTEIAPLVTELNSFIDENAEGLARARRHVANLAHGLKTPLASLAIALDEKGRDPGGELHGLVDEMDRRIRHHLGRARAAALHGPARARTPLAPRLADLASIMPKMHAGKPLAVTAEIEPAIAVACEAQDLDEMLGNLVDNAAKWAKGRVRVSATAEGGEVLIDIEDDGPGLPDDRLPDAIQAGRKLDEAAPGYGFGLPITRELAELYGGRLELGRSELGGVKATLALPSALG